MYLLRHGQSAFNAAFNLTRIDPGIADPSLTAAGRRQAEEATQRLAELGLARVVASPYTRALETASIVAARLGLPIEIDALVRERAAFHCDIGTAKATLADRFPALAFDHLDDPWWHDHIALGVEESEDQLAQRARAFRARMTDAADRQRILVVTHWGFIRAVTGRTVGNCEIVPVVWSA